jgi:hypothetical protein
MLDLLIRRRTRGKLWLFLFALLIPHLTSCAQVEVSLSGDNADIVDVRPYSFNPADVPATPLCPLTMPLASSKQNTGVWCWAASAQMVINYLHAVEEQPPVSQCDIVNRAVEFNPTDDPNCCKAEDGYAPTSGEQGKLVFKEMLNRCRVRNWPDIVLTQYGYNVQKVSPLDWLGLTAQFCEKPIPTPYIIVVRFFDEYNTFAGAHSSVVGGARVTPGGEKYVEVSDHSEDDFFLMKWEAFKDGVQGDFVHEADFIIIN